MKNDVVSRNSVIITSAIGGFVDTTNWHKSIEEFIQCKATSNLGKTENVQ